MPLVEEAEMPNELIMNYSTKRFLDYLKPMPQ